MIRLRSILPGRLLSPRGVRDWMLWEWNEIRPRDGAPYLLRLYVLNTPWFGLKVHWFIGPDPDQDCHDHPWWFLSYLVRGGYAEHRQFFDLVEDDLARFCGEELNLRKARGFAFRKATDVHKIIDVDPDTVTIVLNCRVLRKWGFWKLEPEPVSGPAGIFYRFVPWRRYLGLPEKAKDV